MNHVGLHLAKAQRLGKPLEIAIACQCDPAVHMAAATGIPYGLDEYDYAGGLRGSPVELVKCETVDLEVPATAEYVIEGVNGRFAIPGDDADLARAMLESLEDTPANREMSDRAHRTASQFSAERLAREVAERLPMVFDPNLKPTREILVPKQT